MAGLRVGYVIATNEAIDKWNIIRPPFNVTRISEYAAIAALEDQDYLHDITQKMHKSAKNFMRFHKVSTSYLVKRILFL